MMLDEQKYMREILTDYFMKSSKKNPRISWRSFAKKLGISSSALSEIMSGKRKVSFKKAQELGEKLGISDNEMQRLAQLFQQKPGIRGLEKVSNPFREKVLAKNEWNLHADWRYFAIVALMRTKNFRSDRKWMAERLNLEVSEVKNLISDLASLGVVKEDARGDLTETKTAFRTPLDYPEELFQKRMLEGLGAACRAVEDKASGHVGYYSTISLDPAKLPEAAAMMEDFLKRLSLFLHEGEPREVFELHLQLFPRTTGKS